MYHIWSSQRQVQLFTGKEPNYRGFLFVYGREHPIEFLNSAGPGIACMNENLDAALVERALHSLEAGDDLSGLVRHRYGVECRSSQQPLDQRRQLRSGDTLAVKGAGEQFSLDRDLERFAARTEARGPARLFV